MFAQSLAPTARLFGGFARGEKVPEHVAVPPPYGFSHCHLAKWQWVDRRRLALSYYFRQHRNTVTGHYKVIGQPQNGWVRIALPARHPTVEKAVCRHPGFNDISGLPGRERLVRDEEAPTFASNKLIDSSYHAQGVFRIQDSGSPRPADEQ